MNSHEGVLRLVCGDRTAEGGGYVEEDEEGGEGGPCSATIWS